MIVTNNILAPAMRRLLLLLCLLGGGLLAFAGTPIGAGASLSHQSPGALGLVTANSDCQSSTSPTCDYASGDTLSIPSLKTGDSGRCGTTSISAPVNVYDMTDSNMGIPIADCDVVRENFGAAFPGYGGYPGNGGTTVLAGHVDYHPNYQAVFWNLRSIQNGAEIDYIRGDGKVITYSVDWAAPISDPNYDWSGLVAAGSTETIVLITCDGTFNSATHEYDHRFVAHSTGLQASSRLLSIVGANALLELQPGTQPLPAGTMVQALLLANL